MMVRTTLLNMSFRDKLKQNEQAVPPSVQRDTVLYQSKTSAFWAFISLVLFDYFQQLKKDAHTEIQIRSYPNQFFWKFG